MSNEVKNWAVFENDICVTIIVATTSVIEEFQQRHPENGYIAAEDYGLGAGDNIRRDDWRVEQEDGSYKYYRKIPIGINEQGETIYETRELIYLGE